MLDNWRLQRNPTGHLRYTLWHDMNRREMEIRKQIRREMIESERDTAFPEKNLRDSLFIYIRQIKRSDPSPR